MVNIVQRVGGSLGTALFAVVLERQIAASVPGGSGGGLEGAAGSVVNTPAAAIVADAFGSTFWWVVGSTVLAVLPAVFLPRVGAAAPAETAAPMTGQDAVVEADAVDDLSAGAPLAGSAERA